MKQKVPMICNIVSLILLIVFVIKSIVDYTQYSTSLNSAPFYLWVLVNAVFVKRKCEQKGPKKVSTFSTRFHVVSNVFPKYQMLTF